MEKTDMIKLHAYAKLNLSLDITGKRANGYHELDTIMQSISLFDTVIIRKADYMRVHFDNDKIDGKKSTVSKALRCFMEKTGIAGADICVQKRIPLMSGLGGASADAAAALIGLNKLFRAGLSSTELERMGMRIGADVPFCLTGGTARAKGIGEELKPLSPLVFMHYAVIKPRKGVATAAAFSRYTKSAPISMESVEYAVLKGDIKLYLRHADNALGLAALSISPEILGAGEALIAAGAERALLSGSGSSMFAPFLSLDEARRAAGKVNGDYELCGAYSPCGGGVKVIEFGEDI
ncbi:MAG: 4-(cytidine 5'-diphospho)-2-C-methyl-D-erythritol kinase [Christensenellales bacterium]